ncbi:hypothetical protein CBR_g30729 [Chara braunii]|uniref:AB hydrolase-1 domain-containing protein n=1 Tax=Chara braunii TaxID=69332 RepID=A0A388LDI1_CHABU|nr:hypothetical protein CBR_g30729 [Chara braunii]|eukprot:GBG80361.1 hypothetical protein CBR_g30729 [Chara braunii]
MACGRKTLQAAWSGSWMVAYGHRRRGECCIANAVELQKIGCLAASTRAFIADSDDRPCSSVCHRYEVSGGVAQEGWLRMSSAETSASVNRAWSPRWPSDKCRQKMPKSTARPQASQPVDRNAGNMSDCFKLLMQLQEAWHCSLSSRAWHHMAAFRPHSAVSHGACALYCSPRTSMSSRYLRSMHSLAYEEYEVGPKGVRRVRGGRGMHEDAAADTEEAEVAPSAPKASSSRKGTGERRITLTALVVHGLFGSGRNWRTVSRAIAEAAVTQTIKETRRDGDKPVVPTWRLLLVDMRNHGRSTGLPGFDPPHDIRAAGQDLIDLFRHGTQSQWPELVMGHSLGGKVVLEYTQALAEETNGKLAAAQMPQQVWVLDSIPGPGPAPDPECKGSVERVLSVLEGLPNPMPSRRWFQEHITERGFSVGLAEWLGTNLVRIDPEKEEVAWNFDIPGVTEMFQSYRRENYMALLEKPPAGTRIDFVRAARSDRWLPDVVAELEAAARRDAPLRKVKDVIPFHQRPGTIGYHVLEKAGHWLHVDNPGGLLKLMVPSFVRLAQEKGAAEVEKGAESLSRR